MDLGQGARFRFLSRDAGDRSASRWASPRGGCAAGPGRCRASCLLARPEEKNPLSLNLKEPAWTAQVSPFQTRFGFRSQGARQLRGVAGWDVGRKRQGISCESPLDSARFGFASGKPGVCLPHRGCKPSRLGMEILILDSLLLKSRFPARPPGGSRRAAELCRGGLDLRASFIDVPVLKRVRGSGARGGGWRGWGINVAEPPAKGRRGSALALLCTGPVFKNTQA